MATNGGYHKLCFVTIGATAGFQSLIDAVLDLTFVQTLRDHGYTELRVQYGNEGKAIFDAFTQADSRAQSAPDDACIEGVLVTGFDFKNEGLAADMREAKGGIDAYIEGVIISHAGE